MVFLSLAVIFFFSSSAFAWDLTSIETVLVSAEADIKVLALAILTALVTVWLGRKFVKITNHS